MALHGKRHYLCGDTYIHGFMFEVAEKGVMVTKHPTSFTGSGDAGDADNYIQLPDATTETPFGILLTDVVSFDLAEACYLGDKYRMETTVCNPVVTARKGIFKTNMLVSGLTITADDALYWQTDGLWTNVQPGAQVSVGRFEGTVDSNGYVSIYLDI